MAQRGYECQIPLYKVFNYLDGTHTIAKKGGESVAYQGHKKAKTTNILPLTDGHGFIIAFTGLIAGNHNDAFNLKEHLQTAFKWLKRLGVNFSRAFFNADKAFDTSRSQGLFQPWRCPQHARKQTQSEEGQAWSSAPFQS